MDKEATSNIKGGTFMEKIKNCVLSEETKRYLKALDLAHKKEKELNKPVPYIRIAPDRIKDLIEHDGTIEDAIETLDMLPEEMGDKIYAPYVLVHLHTAIKHCVAAVDHGTDEQTAIDIIDDVYHWCDGCIDLDEDGVYRAEMKKALTDYFAVYPESDDLISNIFKAIDMDPGKVSRMTTNKHMFSSGLMFGIERYRHYRVDAKELMAADDLDADE